MLKKKSLFIPTNKTLPDGDVKKLTTDELSFIEEYAYICQKYNMQFVFTEENTITLGELKNRAEDKLELFWGF